MNKDPWIYSNALKLRSFLVLSPYLKFKTKEPNFHKIWFFLVDELERELEPR